MFDQAQRSLWLEDQLWHWLREVFPELRSLPSEVLITVENMQRGRSEKIKPAVINTQWTGNTNEKAFISVAGRYFDTPRNVARALLFGAAKHTGGARWGASRVGITKEDDGTLTESPECAIRLNKVMDNVGEPPAGFGVPFPVRDVQRTRLRKYLPQVGTCIVSGQPDKKHHVLRIASDDEEVSCRRCGCTYDPA